MELTAIYNNILVSNSCYFMLGLIKEQDRNLVC